MQVPFLFLTSKKRCQYIFHGDRTIFSCGDRQQCLPRQRGGCRRVLLQTSGKCIGVAKAPKHETSCCLLLPVCSRAPLQVEACLRRSLLIDFITELPERFGEGGLKFFSLQNDKCRLLVHLQFWCIHMKHAVLGHGRAFNPWLVRLARSTRSKRRRQKLAPLATKCHRLLGPHASVIHMSVLTVRCGVSSPRVSPEFRFWVVLASYVEGARLCIAACARSCCLRCCRPSSEMLAAGTCSGGSSLHFHRRLEFHRRLGNGNHSWCVCTGVFSPSGSCSESEAACCGGASSRSASPSAGCASSGCGSAACVFLPCCHRHLCRHLPVARGRFGNARTALSERARKRFCRRLGSGVSASANFGGLNKPRRSRAFESAVTKASLAIQLQLQIRGLPVHHVVLLG